MWGQCGNAATLEGGGEKLGNHCGVRGREGPCTYPARASLPALLSGSRNWLKGNREGGKESKQPEKSLELEVLGLFGLAEPPPGPLPAALQTDSHTPRHMCACVHTQAYIHAQMHTQPRAVRPARTHNTHRPADANRAQAQTHGVEAPRCWGGGFLRFLLAPPRRSPTPPPITDTPAQPLTAATGTPAVHTLSSKLFTYMNLFNPPNSPRRQAL